MFKSRAGRKLPGTATVRQRQMVMDSFDWHEAGLTVGQVAERSGAAPSALRFYERQGLISADRSASNQRRYRGDVLCRVAIIRVCQQAGLSRRRSGPPWPRQSPTARSPAPRNGNGWHSTSAARSPTASASWTACSAPSPGQTVTSSSHSPSHLSKQRRAPRRSTDPPVRDRKSGDPAR